MAGTISMAGIGSGMDVNGMIDGIIKANSAQLDAMKARAQEDRSASASISDIATMLGSLKTASDALADSNTIQNFAVSSTDSAIATSISGAANGGKFSVEVKDVALEYRAYSDTQSSVTGALNLSGTMNIQVGTGTANAIQVDSTDSLSSIVTKINDAGIGVRATTVYDGTNFRLQLRGAATGAGSEVTVSGIDLGLNKAENIKQQAQNAHLTIDGFDVYSKTNQVTGAIPGVTLTVSNKTTSPATVEVKPDASSLQTKIQSVVNQYNAVIKKVQSLAGYSTNKAANSQLAGDSTLRELTMKMGSTITDAVDTGTNSSYTTMRSIGISLQKDGTLSLDQTVLSQAVATSPEAVSKILAGTSTSVGTSLTPGIMDKMSDLVKSFTVGTGAFLNVRKDTFDSAAKRADDQSTAETDRLSRMRDSLSKSFSAMDSTVSSSNSMMTYLQNLPKA